MVIIIFYKSKCKNKASVFLSALFPAHCSDHNTRTVIRRFITERGKNGKLRQRPHFPLPMVPRVLIFAHHIFGKMFFNLAKYGLAVIENWEIEIFY